MFAARLQLWLDDMIETFEERIIPVDQMIGLEWSDLAAPISRAPIE
jgi:hypothetical protein